MDFIIISGLSGAGKSKAASFLEDIGFYVVDNMPAPLIDPDRQRTVLNVPHTGGQNGRPTFILSPTK